jgi:hypothetical protein
LSKITIGRQFCGPPNSGNGGYVCGVMAKDLEGPVTAVIRAPVPLETELAIEVRNGAAVLIGAEGALIGQGGPATQALPDPPMVPTLEQARAASAGYLGHTQRVHHICFTCGNEREEGDGLRVFPGQIEGAESGVMACTWTPHASFGGADGTVAAEVVWAALDCPGFFAWVQKDGRHGALLGTMTGEIITPPVVGQEYVILAWPIVREGRKEIAGVALFDAEGRLMGRGHQVWITMAPRMPAPAATGEAVQA